MSELNFHCHSSVIPCPARSLENFRDASLQSVYDLAVIRAICADVLTNRQQLVTYNYDGR